MLGSRPTAAENLNEHRHQRRLLFFLIRRIGCGVQSEAVTPLVCPASLLLFKDGFYSQSSGA